MDDVAFLSVLVLAQRNPRRGVGIVLDVLHRRRLVVFVALEIDDPVLTLVATADATHRDVTVIVASARFLERLDQRFLGRRSRDVREIRNASKARALCYRLGLTNSPFFTLQEGDGV